MPDPVAVRLCFHDHCFDGAASAAIFSRFYRERVNPQSEFHYSGMTHRATQPFEDGIFDGDENVIVDFKYSSSPRVTWWFDHHQSAFLKPADAENFRADRSGHKFYDPTYKSCTKLLADVTSTKFGFDVRPLAELIHWGDIIDGAQFPTPESAVGLGRARDAVGAGDRGRARTGAGAAADPGAGASLARGDGEIAHRGAAPRAAARAAQANDRSVAGARGRATAGWSSST